MPGPNLGPRLRRAFFERDSERVARDLIGARILHRLAPERAPRRGGDLRLVARIVEVEAYRGDGTDPASHAHIGPTARNATMFGPPGRLYAYRSYGIHTCVNVVCRPKGTAEAVLLRALEPISGESTMRALRGIADDAPERQIASGPGRLGQALGLCLEDDGRSLLGTGLELYAAPRGEPRAFVESGPRVGITKAADLPLRFFDGGSACVSAFRPGKHRKRS